MCGDNKQFLSLTTYNDKSVTFGNNNNKDSIVGIYKVGRSLFQLVDNVYYVNGFQNKFIEHFLTM